MPVCDIRDNYEIIEGVKYMAPSSGWGHVNITANLVTDEERAEVKREVSVAVLDGFKVKIRNIFGRYFE